MNNVQNESAVGIEIILKLRKYLTSNQHSDFLNF